MDPCLLLFLSLPMAILGQGGNLPPQCSLEPAYGNCNEEQSGWYFNHTEGGCRWFSYSGCGGNGQIFQTLTQCLHACTCNMPSETGRCRAHMPSYFFNSASGQCESFVYGGCGGNENRFGSLSQCKQTCICTRDKEVGLCRAAFPAFYFDDRENRCKPFTYGGCGGNANRFDSMESCNDECVCNMEHDSGMCMAYFPMFYYDAADRTCKGFVYGGCQGNGNRFPDVATCTQTCARGAVL